MEKETTGTIVSVKKQWWLKINANASRMGSRDGAMFPFVIKVQYTVAGKEHVKRMWVMRKDFFPAVGDTVRVIYDDSKPEKIKITY